MQFRDIQYAIAAAETGSFSRASECVCVTQSALSQGIQRLEDELGVKLFNRGSIPVALTPAGELFLEDAYTIMQAYNAIPQKMADLQNLKRGKVKIGISLFYGRYSLSKIIPQFRQEYPGIELNLVEAISAEQEELLLKGRLDICVFSLPLNASGIIYEPLFEERILLAVPKNHPINAQFEYSGSDNFPEVALSLFSKEGFIMIKNGQRMYTLGMELCREAGFLPKIVFETRSIETANALAAAGMGISFIPEAVRKVAPLRDHAVYYNLKPPAKRTYVAAYQENGYLPAAAKAFINFIKQKNELFS
jgi:LysR family hydrogen peroxide-inducible transcriptional activator